MEFIHSFTLPNIVAQGEAVFVKFTLAIGAHEHDLAVGAHKHDLAV